MTDQGPTTAGWLTAWFEEHGGYTLMDWQADYINALLGQDPRAYRRSEADTALLGDLMRADPALTARALETTNALGGYPAPPVAEAFAQYQTAMRQIGEAFGEAVRHLGNALPADPSHYGLAPPPLVAYDPEWPPAWVPYSATTQLTMETV